ncbi:hypothetical protein EVAR_11535_1 [Eumeta japonica]|uniref:Uncharacterized protein n=1 Tax=Eumeta variegata TaxID=151549 RepID=A0A4C1TYR7_EUMVA|nr:hypothetical protein EVAR_11535_1 [Eumeta japonica]
MGRRKYKIQNYGVHDSRPLKFAGLNGGGKSQVSIMDDKRSRIMTSRRVNANAGVRIQVWFDINGRVKQKWVTSRWLYVNGCRYGLKEYDSRSSRIEELAVKWILYADGQFFPCGLRTRPTPHSDRYSTTQTAICVVSVGREYIKRQLTVRYRDTSTAVRDRCGFAEGTEGFDVDTTEQGCNGHEFTIGMQNSTTHAVCIYMPCSPYLKYRIDVSLRMLKENPPHSPLPEHDPFKVKLIQLLGL